jgi:acyl-CoA-binding protein
MITREIFDNAVAESKQLTVRPDNNTLLQLYSLYKQATEGDVKGDSPTNPFDFIAKAKYNAWDKLKGMSAEAAMQQYVDIVARLKAGN